METLLEQTQESLQIADYVLPELSEISKDRAGKFIGEITLPFVVEKPDVKKEDSETTLKQLLQEAARGSEAAYTHVQRNVATDVAERLYKAGHITEVTLQVRNGHIEQDGIPLRDIHKNTLQNMPLNEVMRKRTEIELKNAFAFEELWNSNTLDYYDALIFSLVPTDEETREDYNFFTDTDSLSVQELKKTGENKITMETAMVAGKTSPDSERHDISAIKEVLDEAGFNTVDMDENDILSVIVLVPKSEGSGVHRMVQKIDNLIGGTFFGQNKQPQDYETYRWQCREREKNFNPIIDRVIKQLLDEAYMFDNPYEVIERLDQLSSEYCLEFAIDNKTADIDLHVFGGVAAGHIEQARIAKDAGDNFAAQMHLAFAKKTSTDSSCPTLRSKRDEYDESSAEDSSINDDTDCEFISKECPLCGKKNVKTKVEKIRNGKNKGKKLITGSCNCSKVA